VLESVNVILSSYEDELGDIQLDPLKGNVFFGAGKQGWAFALPQIWPNYCKETQQKMFSTTTRDCGEIISSILKPRSYL